jgi:pimeloyl-ACP methyl ester carboxylesterase
MLKRLARLSFGVALFSLTATFAFAATEAPVGDGSRMVELDGHQVRVRSTAAPKPGMPTVVFVSGGFSRLENWDRVQPQIAKTWATFTYDRSGNGKSEPGKERPTLTQNATELHAILEKTGFKPPYILVSHSYGGPIVRKFAASYPNEIVGLVFVDPVDFLLTPAERNQPDVKNLYAAFDRVQAELLAHVPDEMKPNGEEANNNVLKGFPELRNAAPLPDVPMVVLVAGQMQPVPKGISFPEYKPWFEVDIRRRVANMYNLTRQVSHGWLIVTPDSSHYIQLIQPELVLDAIQRVATAPAKPAADGPAH